MCREVFRQLCELRARFCLTSLGVLYLAPEPIPISA
jgi:hypothetical protein